MNNFPIVIIYYLFPIFSIIARIIGRGQLNYDYIWVPSFVLALVLSIGAKYRKRFIILITCIGVLMFLKYILPLLFIEKVQWRPWLMDCKWIVYLLFSIFWINRFGIPSGKHIYEGSLFFSKVYIIYAIYLFLTSQLDREGILMESNYDGFMILMGFCWIDQFRKGKYDLLIFLTATFLTLSRTGFVAILILLIYKVARRNVLWLIPMTPVVLFFVYLAVMMRGSSAVESLDRFVFYYQTYIYLTWTSVDNVLLGCTPGVSLDMPIADGFQWYIDNFENMRNVRGIYPFYFHSTYLRLVMTWGILGCLLYFLFFVRRLYTAHNNTMRYFCVLVLVQSFSLSVLTLQNVSVLFFMMLFALLSIEKKSELPCRIV